MAKKQSLKPFYEASIELTELQLSVFKDIIPILNKTRKFQKEQNESSCSYIKSIHYFQTNKE